MGFRCSTGQLAIVLELVAKIASEQARDLALHISRMSIKVLLEHVGSMAKMLTKMLTNSRLLAVCRDLFVFGIYLQAALFPRSVCGSHL